MSCVCVSALGTARTGVSCFWAHLGCIPGCPPEAVCPYSFTTLWGLVTSLHVSQNSPWARC